MALQYHLNFCDWFEFRFAGVERGAECTGRYCRGYLGWGAELLSVP
jgi:hypothetical protein